MIDYKFKAEVIRSGVHKVINRLDRKNYLNCQEGVVRDYALENEYFELFNKYGSKYITEAKKINLAAYRRVERLKDRIMTYISNFPCVWLTLTFKDEILGSTSSDTRRKYCSRFLKSLSDYYVANIDFGVDDRYTKREHYHALVVGCITNNDLTWWQDNCGFTYIENVRVRSSTDKKLAMYVSKLTNHAIKESTKRIVYIYSRKKYGN